MSNPVQDILNRMTFKPFWWFSSQPFGHQIDLLCQHLTISSTKDFKLERALTVLEAVQNIKPTFSSGQLIVSNHEHAGEVATHIEDGWCVYNISIHLPKSFWNKEGVIQAVRHLIDAVDDHDRDEFLRVDGEFVKHPHPTGGNTVPILDLIRETAA